MMIDLPARGYRGRIYLGSFLRYRPLWLNYDGSEELTDFQVKCTLTNKDIAFEKLRADKRDLLFIAYDGQLIPYWIESFNDTEIIVWLKFPKIIPGKEVFWLYYGNGNFSGISDASLVFDFFDDFENYADGDVPNYFTNIKLGSWGSAGGVSYEVVIYDEKKMLKVFAPNDGDYGIIAVDVNLQNKIVESEGILASHIDGDFLGLAVRTIDANQYVAGRAQARDDWIDVIDESDRVSKTVTIDVGVYYNLKLIAFENRATFYVGDDSIQKTIPIRSGKIGIFYGECDARYDYIRVRKYTSPEPSVST